MDNGSLTWPFWSEARLFVSFSLSKAMAVWPVHLKMSGWRCGCGSFTDQDPAAGLSPWQNVDDCPTRGGSPLPATVHWELQ